MRKKEINALIVLHPEKNEQLTAGFGGSGGGVRRIDPFRVFAIMGRLECNSVLSSFDVIILKKQHHTIYTMTPMIFNGSSRTFQPKNFS